MTSTPRKPVENVVITMKGLQDRNIHIFDGTTVENKGKLILNELNISLTSFRETQTEFLLFRKPLSVTNKYDVA